MPKQPDPQARLIFDPDAVVVVIGSSSGIGRAVVERFLRCGLQVVGLARRLDDDSQLSGLGRWLGLAVDVQDSAQVTSVFVRIVQSFGHIDVLVYCAGITQRSSIVETTYLEWSSVLRTNLDGAYLCAKEVIPHMRQSQGNMVFVGSVGSFVSWENEAAYQASKSGLLGLVRAIALENAPWEVRANAVCPGLIDAPMLTSWIYAQHDPAAAINDLLKEVPLGRLGQADEVAEAVLFLSSQNASYITGCALLVDGGYCAR